ncbi:DNA double-strand break repair Rad50 ATPase [Listeria seeligeri]|uniref:DNA double-strand break repair Rad50 ATPase n=3 Tax=Listeria seeligeri TaxID=1640 RepID=UPI0010D5F134|nr:DNA double-strand break repair Rad50 ATPase [Listeria seeligeri]MBC1732684.1 DNA double-strand break repair Rad50 ATPase [Listeria seeligeri]MBC1810384.1 DNA double-strand break repair Rad50 ATPase [Listeria seeligeri]MBC1895449.1 DNA double-strand break repair Rad50 ATPase [Listeria seeligeri]MBC1901428.1 DNA double-strand break repair Rad50 ATPase [Listeria seeligeri]MBC2204936.1 DNA double-strand break repair Rad50 ATPase [Listeria seeligeri]
MDENSYQLEQQLQTLQKQQREAETTLEALKREQNDQAWLEEDFSRICHEEQEAMAYLRDVWQSAKATSFGHYLEDVHEQEKTSWRKQFQAKEAEMQTKLASCQKTMHQLENQQRSIRKELIQ